MQFETFDKATVAFAGEPHVTIQKRGTITINAGSYAALNEPDAVELLFDPEEQVLGLRKVDPSLDHAAYVRPSTQSAAGPWVISAMAFVRHYRIDTALARRWIAELVDGVLAIRLRDPGEVVSRSASRTGSARQPTRQSGRPRPRPHA